MFVGGNERLFYSHIDPIWDALRDWVADIYELGKIKNQNRENNEVKIIVYFICFNK